jgi:hypothetical protein
MYKFVSEAARYKPGNSAPPVSTTRSCSTRARCTSRSSPATARPRRSTAPASCPRRRVRRCGEWIPLAAATSPRSCRASPPRRCTSSPGSPRTRWAPPRWTAPRTSSRARTGKDLRRADQQHRPRQAGQGRRRRGQPAQRTTSTATSWRWEENRGDHTGDRFAWKLLLVCGDPAAPDTYFAGYDKSQVSPISCPDNVAFDSTATCGSPPTATRSARTTACSRCRSRARARAREAVPDRAARRGDLRPVVTV